MWVFKLKLECDLIIKQQIRIESKPRHTNSVLGDLKKN